LVYNADHLNLVATTFTHCITLFGGQAS
jgi:hypothetical protein